MDSIWHTAQLEAYPGQSLVLVFGEDSLAVCRAVVEVVGEGCQLHGEYHLREDGMSLYHTHLIPPYPCNHIRAPNSWYHASGVYAPHLMLT